MITTSMDTKRRKQMAKKMRRLKLTLKRQDTCGWKPLNDCFYELCDGRGQQFVRFCPVDFHAATGFVLKPGTKEKITITIKKRK